MNARNFFGWLLAILFLHASCKPKFNEDDYTAYFGGEVLHPKVPYVLLFKGDVLVDSIKIDRNNRFFVKFDSLAPGLYTFRHEPEYQYIYFDKNDSLLVAIDSKDFDESIVFTGRGERKNNYLVESYLRNERERDSILTIFDNDFAGFNRAINSIYNRNTAIYEKQKSCIDWSEGFDMYAKASVDLSFFSKKEMYPVMHKIRTGEDLIPKLPKDYYHFRKDIDFNNEKLAHFSPFIKYVSHLLNNMAAMQHRKDEGPEATLALKANMSKMKIADSLIQNKKIKNMILNQIAYNYLMEDQNMHNNERFFETYQRYSTDKSEKAEFKKIVTAIHALKSGNKLPEISLQQMNGHKTLSSTFKKPTVIFFWSNHFNTHFVESHKRILEIKKLYPDFDYVAINIDENQEKWLESLENYNFEGIKELRACNFEDLRKKWVLTKIYRTIILNGGGIIKEGFTNIFESNFVEKLN